MQGQLEDHILQWLQADPYWGKLGQHAKGKSCNAGQKLCMGAMELAFKHEEGGYVGRSPPGCKFCNNLDMSTRSQPRVCQLGPAVFSSSTTAGWPS